MLRRNVVVGLLSALAVAGAAFAAGQSSGGSVRACYHKGTGALRILLRGRCSTGERAIAWSRIGPTGATGPAGAPGRLPATLPSGETEKGVYDLAWTASGAGDITGNGISFAIPLAAAPSGAVVKYGQAPTADCPGSVANPSAAAGHLCLYEGHPINVSGATDFGEPDRGDEEVSPFGFYVFVRAAAAGSTRDNGTWAVTAP